MSFEKSRRKKEEKVERQAVQDSGPTPVTIFGRTYYLRGDGDRRYLEELAALVDHRMQEVADTTGTADTLKVAILAALNIADEFKRARRQGVESDRTDHGERLARIVALLDEALVG